jgi:hypothetical protein
VDGCCEAVDGCCEAVDEWSGVYLWGCEMGLWTYEWRLARGRKGV